MSCVLVEARHRPNRYLAQGVPGPFLASGLGHVDMFHLCSSEVYASLEDKVPISVGDHFSGPKQGRPPIGRQSCAVNSCAVNSCDPGDFEYLGRG